MPSGTLGTGAWGEDIAAGYLLERGFTIVHRNWRHKQLEIDLVCRQGETVVFVEVKTRGAGALESGAEALTPAKRGKLARAAAHYLSEHDLWDAPARFDLVAIDAGHTPPDIEHVADAFPMQNMDAGWQPW